MINMNNFKRLWEKSGDEILSAVGYVGASAWYVLGREVQDFESEMASLFHYNGVVGVANGLDAIEIALRVVGIKHGDKVVTTPMSAFATTLAIYRAGGIPVFIDTDDNGLIDLSLAEKFFATHPDVKFFLPVHLFGFPLNLKKLEDLKKKFGLKLVEDCAQCIGAKWGDINAGTVGDISATSFYPTKNLGALGDGGAVILQDTSLEQKVRVLRDYGQIAKYEHIEMGLNSRLDEVQASILRRVMLKNIERWTDTRREIARRYLTEIKNPSVRLPVIDQSAEPVWHLFPVNVPNKQGFRKALKEAGIETGEHYPKLIPDQLALRGQNFEIFGDLNLADKFAATQVSLPMNPFLESDEVSEIISTVNKWVG